MRVVRRGRGFSARWRDCGGRKARLRARFLQGCDTVAVRWRRGGARARFIAVRSRCGDGLTDPRALEACDDGNAADCDACAADCGAVTDACLAASSCAAYARPPHPPATCPDVTLDRPDVLTSCTSGSGDAGSWTVDADGLPAYDLLVDERCDAAATAYSPRPRPLRDPIHVIGNGRGLMAMAHASGGIELYTQDRGHKWVNRIDLWRDPDDAAFPPQLGGGFSYFAVAGSPEVGSTRFEDRPVGAPQSRRFGVGYVETVTPAERIAVRRRVLAPDSDARALVAEVEVTNPTGETLDYGLVEFWDPNLHQVALELLTSDLLQAGTTDAIERRRRALAGRFTQRASWDPARRVAVLETTATAPQVATRSTPSQIDWFPEPVFLAPLDDGVAPDRVWLADDELWPDRDRVPPRAATAAGDGAPARTRDLAGAGQHAVLAIRVALRLGPGEHAVRRFAFGMVPGGGAPDATLAALRARATTLAADTARSWHDRLVWAAFPGLARAAALQRELAWSSYAAIANTSFDEYRGVRVLGQGGAYRYIHGLDGAMGDLALFAESMLLIDPGIARDTLAYAFGTQLAGSQATPWRYPYATTGVGSFSDVGIYDRRSDAYWFLPAITGKYVGLTRDAGFLDEPLPYWPRAAGETGTVREHIAHGLDYALDEATLGIGARGLVAIGTNDYADGVLNLTTERPVTPTGSSSAYNAGMIVYGLPLAADVLESRDAALGARLRAVVASQTTALLDAAWEGHYFWRGFVDSGDPLAPQLFFLEPQVFPVLAGIVAPDRRDLALGEVRRRLETPIGALSTVAIGTVGPIGGIDQPLVGGIWPVANAWLTAAYARRDPLEGWTSLVQNTLAAHADLYPQLWYGIWTGPDSFNGPASARPGEADAHIATALTDYPALNAHVHTSPLRALVDVLGVAGTRDGMRITPHVPTETFAVRWPRLDDREHAGRHRGHGHHGRHRTARAGGPAAERAARCRAGRHRRRHADELLARRRRGALRPPARARRPRCVASDPGVMTAPMVLPLAPVARYRVLFADCDPMRIMYYASYFRLFEIGRAELFRGLGHCFADYVSRGLYLAVVSAACRYRRPTRYDDDLEIRCGVRALGRARITIAYEIARDGEVVVDGETEHALVDDDGKPQRLPADFRALLLGEE